MLTRHFRRAIAIGAVLIMTTTLVLAGGAPANAVQLEVTCVGTSSGTMTPGLTYTPQTVQISTNLIYSPCVSTDPTLTAATSGSVSSFVGASCLMLPFVGSGSFTLFWNNGNTSTFTFNAASAIVGGLIVLTRTGTITAGQFQGATAIRTVTYPPLNPLECRTTGVTSNIGVIALSVTTI